MALFPFAGDNSIQNVVFALEWAEPLTNSDLAAIYAYREDPKATLIRKTFPQVQQQRMVTINLDADSGAQHANAIPNELGGINFTRPSVTNIGAASRALIVSKSNCLAVVSEYTRWATVWAEVREWLSLITPKIADARPITTIGLQYTDVFLWKAAPSSFDLNSIFSQTTDFLPKNAFKTNGLWHSHHGYFARHEIPIQHDLLENVNVNVLENTGLRSIQILTSHKAILTTPIWKSMEVMDALDLMMPDLHSRNKAVLEDLLTPEVKAAIKLKSN